MEQSWKSSPPAIFFGQRYQMRYEVPAADDVL